MELFNVLVVDDDAFVRQSLKRLNVWGESSGFVIGGEAKNGQEALDKLNAAQFDLVLTDIRMPKVDGIQLLIRIVEAQLAPCVVFISEHSEFRYAKQGMVYGAFDYLVKPVNEEEIRTLLQRTYSHIHALKRNGEKMQLEIQTTVPHAELQLLKRYLCAGDDKTSKLSGVISQLIRISFGNDPRKAHHIFQRLLLDLQNFITAEMFWLETFVNVEAVFHLNAPLLQSVEQEAEAFVKVTDELLALTKRFGIGNDNNLIVREVKKYILTNIDRDISAKSIALALFVNRSYLSEMFKEKTGMLLGDYIVALKMERAKIMLVKSNGKIIEIAEQLGYKDSEYFSKLFKAQFGLSPSDYRSTRHFSG